jgi:hypothetical protein
MPAVSEAYFSSLDVANKFHYYRVMEDASVINIGKKSQNIM